MHHPTVSKNDDLVAVQKAVLEDSDYYTMMDDETGKEFRALGNGGCQKLAAELDYAHRIDGEKCVERDGYARYGFTASILDNGGRVLAQDVGACDTAEKPGGSLHNIRSTAKTRAWQRALKTAARVNDRLVSDLGPTERSADAPTRAAPQAAPKAAAPKSNGRECACSVGDVTEPRLVDGIHLCGTCSKPIQKTKRIQFLSANS